VPTVHSTGVSSKAEARAEDSQVSTRIPGPRGQVRSVGRMVPGERWNEWEGSSAVRRSWMACPLGGGGLERNV